MSFLALISLFMVLPLAAPVEASGSTLAIVGRAGHSGTLLVRGTTEASPAELPAGAANGTPGQLQGVVFRRQGSDGPLQGFLRLQTAQQEVMLPLAEETIRLEPGRYEVVLLGNGTVRESLRITTARLPDRVIKANRGLTLRTDWRYNSASVAVTWSDPLIHWTPGSTLLVTAGASGRLQQGARIAMRVGAASERPVEGNLVLAPSTAPNDVRILSVDHNPPIPESARFEGSVQGLGSETVDWLQVVISPVV